MHRQRRLRHQRTIRFLETLESRRLLSTASTASNWPNVLTTDTTNMAAAPQVNTTTQYSLRELVQYYNGTYNSDSMPMTIDLTSDTIYTLSESANDTSEGGRNNNSNEYGALDIEPLHTTEPLIIVGAAGAVLTCDKVDGLPLDRLIHVISGGLEIQDVTLTKGEARDNSTGQYTDALGGAALVNPGGSLSLTNCSVLSNKAVASTDAIAGQTMGISAAGGGVYGSAGSVINIAGSTTFSNNQVYAGDGDSNGPTGYEGGAAYGGGLAIGAPVNEPSAVATPVATSLSFTGQSGAQAAFEGNHLNVTTKGLATGATGGSGSHTGGAGGNAYGGGLYVGSGSLAYPSSLAISGGSTAAAISFSDNEIAGGAGNDKNTTATLGTGGSAYGAGGYIEPWSVSVTDGPAKGGIMTFTSNTELDYTGYTSSTVDNVVVETPTTNTVAAGLELPAVSPSTPASASTTPWNLPVAVAAVNPLADTGMTITLNLPASASTYSGGATISATGKGSLIISGAGVSSSIISGTGVTGSIFTIENDADVVFQGLTIEDGSATNGGAIYATSAVVALSTVSVLKNSSSSNGGGIYQSGGSLALQGNSNVENNSSANGGGIWLWDCKFSMTGGQLSGNAATTSGGAIYAYGETSTPATLSDVTVSSNTSDGSDGGGICATNLPLTLTSCTFSDNSAGYGGALFVNGSSTVSMSGGSISSDSATNGAGIYATSWSKGAPSVKLSNVSMMSNDATGSGGGIYQTAGSLALTNDSEVKDNKSGSSGAGIWLSNSGFKMSGGELTDNTAGASGGALSDSGSPSAPASLSSVTVSSNSSTGGSGGGIQGTNLPLTLTDCAFSSNSASGNGGAIAVNGSSTLDSSGGTISKNKANDGAGIYAGTANGAAPSVNAAGLLISSNTASSSGGGIYQSHGSLGLDGVTLQSNIAGGDGAGLFASSVKNNMTSDDISSNSISSGSNVAGAGLYLSGGSLATSGMAIAKNTITVTNNETIEGAGLYANDTPVTLSSTSSLSVNLSASFNRLGLATDGVPFSGGGADGGGNAYSINLLGSTLGGLGTFDLGTAGQNDVISTAGQTIDVSGGAFNVLDLAAAGVDGNQLNQSFTLTFSDGSSETVTQSFSDWCVFQGYANETVLSSMNYRDTSSGGQNVNTPHVYGYAFPIPTGKILTSITLPNDPNLIILAMNLSSATIVSGNTLTAKGGGNAYGAGIYLDDSSLTTSSPLLVESNSAATTGSSAQIQGAGIDDLSGALTFNALLGVSGNTLSGQQAGTAGGAGILAASADFTVASGVSWTLTSNTISGVQLATGAGLDFGTGCSSSGPAPALAGNTISAPISTDPASSGPVSSNLAFPVSQLSDDANGATSLSDYTSTSGSLRDALSWAESTLLPLWTSIDIVLTNSGAPSVWSSNYQLGTESPLTIDIPSGQSLEFVGPVDYADIQGVWAQTIVDESAGNVAFENVVISGGYSASGASGGGVAMTGSGVLAFVNASVEQNKVVGVHGYHSPTVNTWNNNKTRNSTPGGNASGGGIYQGSGQLYLLGNTVVSSNTAQGGTGGTGTSGNGVAGRTGQTGGYAFGGGIFQTGGSLYLGENVSINSNNTIGGNGGNGGPSIWKQGGAGGVAGTAWAGGVDTEQSATIYFPDGYQNDIMEENVATNGTLGQLGNGTSGFNYPQTSDSAAGKVMNPSNFYDSGQVVSSFHSSGASTNALVRASGGMPQSGGTLALASRLGPGIGQLMPGVVLELRNAAGTLVATAVSDSNGQYRFDTQFTGLGYCDVIAIPTYEIATLGTVGDSGITSSFDPQTGRTALMQFYEGVAVNQKLGLVMRPIATVLRTGPNYVELVNQADNAVIWRDQLAPASYHGGFTYATFTVNGNRSPDFVVLPRTGPASPLIIDGRTGTITFIEGQVSRDLQSGFTVTLENLTGNDQIPDLLLTPIGGKSGDFAVIDRAIDDVAWKSKRSVGGGMTVGFDTFPLDHHDANVVLTSRKFNQKHRGYKQRIFSGETGKLIESGWTPASSAPPIDLVPAGARENVVRHTGERVAHASLRPKRGRHQ
jgi:predicted outer membrane repeat protein